MGTCKRVLTDGLHAYTCMFTSSHPTRIVKQVCVCVGGGVKGFAEQLLSAGLVW